MYKLFILTKAKVYTEMCKFMGKVLGENAPADKRRK